MAPKVEQVSTDLLELGEGPHWDVASQSLYLVDIYGQTIIKYVPSTGSWNKAKLDGKVSLIVPVEGSKDRFVVTIDRKLAVVTWDGVSPNVSKTEILVEVDKDKPGNIFNDGKADPTGRLWAGTLDAELNRDNPVGSLYSLVSKNQVKHHLANIGIANGLAWNTDLNKFYYIDSFTYRVDSFDVDLQKGEISNRETVFKLADHDIEGVPDGMAIDSEGKLWVAIAGGSRVIRVDPVTSELLTTVKFPVQAITSVAWGGPNLDVLYVTSASFENEFQPKPTPQAGATFKVTGLGVRGLPAQNVKL